MADWTNLDKPQGGMTFQRTAGNQIIVVSVWFVFLFFVQSFAL